MINHIPDTIELKYIHKYAYMYVWVINLSMFLISYELVKIGCFTVKVYQVGILNL